MTYDSRGVFKQAVAALTGNPRRGLKSVSEALGVERHTIEGAFQLNVGRTFREFRHELLCARSVELLASKATASIKEIAFLLGYQSERAFARFIRNSFGCCPCELRRQLTVPSSHRAASQGKTTSRAAQEDFDKPPKLSS